MNRKIVSCIFTGLLLSVSLYTFGQQLDLVKRKRPNIIFIFSDDHAYQAISAYGSTLTQTPNIDRLANEGVILKNQLVTNSICGPSRATLLTGKYSHKNGFKANENSFDLNQTLFTTELQKAGYNTAWVGKWHLGTLPTQALNYFKILPGQGHYYNPDFIHNNGDTVRHEGYVTDVITSFARDFIEQQDGDKPFLLVVGHKATHREWMPDIRDLGAFDSVDFPIPESFYDDYTGRAAAKDQDMTIDKTMVLRQDLKVGQVFKGRYTSEQAESLSDYYGEISKEFIDKKLKGKELVEWKYQRYLKDYLSTAKSLDRNIGELLDYLDESGLAENTVVIYASDQGFYLGEHGWFDKRFIYEESLKTPFVLRYPGVVKPGSELQDLVLNIDWAPTVLDLAGAAIPDDIQGNSFLPLLINNQDSVQWRDAGYYHYYEFPQPHRVHPHFGIRTDRYKLVRFYGELNNWELFDLQKDPNELSNVIDDPDYSSVLDSLQDRLQRLILRYGDSEAEQILRAAGEI
ncbi:sulfatase family protein [Sphingobacterium gobiense]|uniref:Sulfatase n=1 Tax=Sphingobacterium gobiense TaxID=1382456 RepID=A0A2S9JS16_9SPHI|nr:sulfatase [Sphingobacterium gobiense]PRD56095.1 sulfatase [Sphingobacterium gobiense]